MSAGLAPESKIGLTAGPEYGGPGMLVPSAMRREDFPTTWLICVVGAKAETCHRCHGASEREREREGRGDQTKKKILGVRAQKENKEKRYDKVTRLLKLRVRDTSESDESNGSVEFTNHHGRPRL